MSKPVACNIYDDIEVACLFQYRLQLTLSGGGSIVGQAQEINVFGATKREVLELRHLGHVSRVYLDEIATITVLTHGARIEDMRVDN